MNPSLRRSLTVMLLLWMQHGTAQSAPVTLEVTATDPEPQSTLSRDDTFYVRVAYTSDRPLRIRIKGRRLGNDVPTMTNPSPVSDPPSGEALVWISWNQRATLDQIQVYAEDQATGRAVAQISLPVSLEWTADVASAARQPAEWASALSRAQQRKVSDDMRRYSERDGGVSGTLLSLVIALSLPVYIAAQIWSLKRLEDGWRKAAWAPLWVMGAALVVSFFALAAGSNLWPIWLVLLAPLAVLWLAGVLIAHRMSAAA